MKATLKKKDVRDVTIEVRDVQYILDNCQKLGIPHFQRGSVWNDDNIALLLESLYFDTPCGNIILWKPETDNGEHGIPLPELTGNSSQKPEYYIVDGQQRIRSLCRIKAEIDSKKTENRTSDEVPYVWAVNLAEFAKVLKNDGLFNRGKVDSLFVKIKDPIRQKISYIEYALDKLNRADENKTENKKHSPLSPEYRNQYNFVPIRVIMKGLNETDEDFWSKIIIRNKDKVVSDIYNAKKQEELDDIIKEFFPDQVGQQQPDRAPTDLKSIKRSLLEKLKADLEKSTDDTIFVDLDEKSGEDVKEFLKRLRDHLLKIFSRKFPIRILETDNMSDIIHTYIRINSGGRSVQEEEKAIARLIRLEQSDASKKGEGTEGKGTFSAIEQLFNTIHPDKKSAGDDNDHFQRAKETQFGFKLFVRVFVLAANYHTGSAIGTQTMNFTAIESNEALETEDGQKKIPKIWDVVKDVTMAVKDLLERELCFDTLAFLPDSRSLWPVFMILIKHPGFIKNGRIREEYREQFAYILLTLLVKVGDSQETIIGLMKDIREFPGDGRCLLRRMIESGRIYRKKYDKEKNDGKKGDKTDRWKDITGAASVKKVMEALQTANAMNNRYILLLYALERHLKAVDFHGESLPGELREKAAFKIARPIGKECTPEKQHIVPYSALNPKREDDLRTGRKINDPANNIGNITYISQALNSYKDGLGSNWLKLNAQQQDLNLGHIITRAAIEKFNGIDHENPNDNGAYKEWTEQRQADIAEAFSDWLKQLKFVACERNAKNKIAANACERNAGKKFADHRRQRRTGCGSSRPTADRGHLAKKRFKPIPHARILVPPPPGKDGKRVFTGLSYLSEVWNIPDTTRKKLELASHFGEAKRKLTMTGPVDDPAYTVYENGKEVWPNAPKDASQAEKGKND